MAGGAGNRSLKNQLKEAIIDEEILSIIKKAIIEALDPRFQEIIDRLDKQDGALFDLQTKVEKLEHGLSNLQNKHQRSEERIQKLESSLNDQEQYSRRNCVRVFGVPERDNENTNQIVCDIATNQLGVSLAMADIDRSHRVGRRSEPKGGSASATSMKPRPIIVKLTSYQHRQNLLRNRRKLKENKTGISIYEDLTTANRMLLWEAFKVCSNKDSKATSAWSMDGRIIVSVQGTNNKTIKKQIHSKEDLANIN